MPGKLLRCKPRNIRAIILVLILGTLAFALYQLILGHASKTGPIRIFVPQETEEANHIQNSFEKEESENEGAAQLPTQTEDKPAAELNLIPRYGKGFASVGSRYEKERETGRCPKIQIFKPDIDVAEIYPDLEFDADWIRSKEYWNPFFENRYKTIKNSRDTPPMKIIVVPHSHNDPGWLKTFDDYYTSQTKHVLDNAVEKMTEFKNMTFLWSEISFLSRWWADAHPRKRALLKNLVKEGRLEIVTGGWVMTDEATVNLYSMIDQLIEGQQWVKTHLGVVPKSSWSVDPFGHGSTFPYILNKAGVTGMTIQRIHYGWKKWLMVHQSSDFQWVQRWDYANKHSISVHNAPYDIYSIKHSCGPHPQICLNFDFKSVTGEYSENSVIMQPITKSNVKGKAELMLEQYGRTASLFPHNMALISMGDDFRFTHPEEWDQQYTNYMKLFNYINSKKDRYNAEVGFGTVADYFEALAARQYHFPTFSGDFHVYSDIFSDGNPAYWSGYYGTRPYWKKFYRETENNLRGAEIVFTVANTLANQKNLRRSQQVLSRSYENLTIARRWLALFAHHDASTGTSKAATMNDYGNKLFEAFQLSKKIQMESIETILFGKADVGVLGTDMEVDGFDSAPRQIPISFGNSSRNSSPDVKKVVIYNSLARHQYQVVTLVVSTPNVEVIGPGGEFIQAQLNPVVDASGDNIVLSEDVFELSFFTSLAPLSLSIFQVRQTSLAGEHNAVRAQVYCKGCKSLQKLFEVNEIQTGDIQLNNDRMTVLFNRNTGMIMGVTKIKEDVSVSVEMKFGSYSPVNFKSGAYLLKPDVQSEQAIPFKDTQTKQIIISGPISTELSVFSEPLIISSKIMHMGDNRMLEAIYMQNQIDLKEHNGEIYMRFDTDLNSVSKTRTHAKSKGNDADGDNPLVGDEESPESSYQPTFYTDQAGFTVEKRVKVPKIHYEGNSYPVNSMAFVQDDARKLRFSILVDRSHGFSSMKTGRLEALVERRTVYDDGRGMGEGVTDNRPTTSNYIILLEKFGPNDKVRHAEHDYRNFQPTLAAHHHSQELSYPAFTYLMDEVGREFSPMEKNHPVDIFPLLSQELPCDSHLINLRTVTDSGFNPDLNIPGRSALLIVQKLGYLCVANIDGEKPGCGNPNPMSLFYPQTKFSGVKVKRMVGSNLAGVEVEAHGTISNLHDITAEPWEIRTVVVTF